jgi:hypothetical protein
VVEDFDELERELREQLQPRPAPPGFAARVAARAAERTPRPRLAWLRGGGPGSAHPIWQWATVAAAVVAMVFGGVEHQRQQRIAGEHARAQVMLALRITATALQDVNQKINQPVQAGNGSASADSR